MRRALLVLSRHGLVGPVALGCIFSHSSMLLTGTISIPLTVIGICICYASYMLDHVSDANRFAGSLQSARVSTVASNRTSQILALLAFVAAVALTWVTADGRALAMLLVFPLAVAMHGTPLLGALTRGSLGYRRIKDIPYAKAFHTAFILALIVPFSALFLRVHQPALTLQFFIFVYLRCFSNTVACDYKDLERDQAEGVRTIPMALGIRPSAGLLLTVDALSAALVVAGIVWGGWPGWTVALAIGVFISSAALIQLVRTWRDHEFLSSVVLDGEFALSLALALLVRGLS